MEFIDVLDREVQPSPENLPPFGEPQFLITPETQRYVNALNHLEGWIRADRQGDEAGTLRDRQVPVMVDMHRTLAAHGPNLRGRVQMPTGSGKTVIFREFARA